MDNANQLHLEVSLGKALHTYLVAANIYMQNYPYISHILLRTHVRMHFKMTIKVFNRFSSVSLEGNYWGDEFELFWPTFMKNSNGFSGKDENWNLLNYYQKIRN